MSQHLFFQKILIPKTGWSKQEAWSNETTDLTTYVLPSSSLGIGMPVTLLTVPAAAALVCISCTAQLRKQKFLIERF